VIGYEETLLNALDYTDKKAPKLKTQKNGLKKAKKNY
jgi:hypothetical protein